MLFKSDKMRRLQMIMAFISLSIAFTGCKEFLEAKPDKKLAVPQTLEDMAALLDNVYMNSYAMIAEVAADNFYHTETIWNSIPAERDREIYTWQNDAIDGDAGAMSGRYNSIFTANVVLEGLADNPPNSTQRLEWERLKGSALFYRAYALAETAQLFTEPYEAERRNVALGIPLKLNPDVNEKSTRGTLGETYDRVISDLKEAAVLLPVASSIATRPNRVAAFGALARVYLYMRDYEKAGLYADTALQLNHELLDYNQLSTTASVPFTRLNKETLFYSYSSSSNLTQSRCKVDSNLYDSYAARDLRKGLFFRANADGSYAFKGSYTGSTSTSFNGITTAELYLIKAECKARANQKDTAMEALNTLMAKRWANGFFVPFTAVDADEALNKILIERRKELVFRAQRWNDLRRLNKEPVFAKILMRKLGNQVYELAPNDKRYVFPIPEDIVQLSGIEQNER